MTFPTSPHPVLLQLRSFADLRMTKKVTGFEFRFIVLHKCLTSQELIVSTNSLIRGNGVIIKPLCFNFYYGP